MNLYAVATEINTRLATLGLVQTNIGPPKSISAPCSVIPFPDTMDYQGAFGRQMDRMDGWEIMVITGKVDDSEALERLGQYADGSGATSVVTVLESKDTLLYDPYESCDFVVVKGCSFEIVEWQGQEFQGAVFVIDVVGSGSA